MAGREQVLCEMEKTGVVAVIRASDPTQLMDVVKALKAGGVTCIEVTMTTPNALDVIAKATKEFAGQCIIGVGTVLDPETARAAILAGAEFVVSPILNPEIITLCRRYSKAVIPGAFTPTEILTAWQAGADVVKVFPATKLGPEFLKDVKGPLPQVKLTPTGGVDLKNAADWIKAGATCIGVGSSLVSKKDLADKNWANIEKTAAAFTQAVRDARNPVPAK
jgi:2-dehydro-3-deoxyphosphogluconate aldolase / (4S)-4-hydroxy-2-oxoglutarate aldolase